ncbi:MAG TPA: DUF502 domain-containing protein [Stellaceae bacterium]|nr:DUF502 domain-containing protein [Stellaceae bacterium]
MPKSDSPAPPRWRLRLGIREHLRAYFIAGILVTGPTALTLYLIWLFVTFIDRSVGALLPAQYNPQTYLHVPGIGLVIVVVGLTLIGAVTAGVLGRIFLRLNERILARMPVVRGLYAAMKQIFETVLAKQSNSFREVVLVQWPREGMWTIAFVTAAVEGEIKARTGADTIAVYVPTTPNPTSGYLMFVPRKDAVTLDMSVEDAIKYVISTGIVAPTELPVKAAEPIATI